MTKPILAPVRGPAAEEPMSPADPWAVVEELFNAIFAQLDAGAARFNALEAAAHGRDGIGIVDATIDDRGSLILKLSDGSQRNVGLVVGRPPPAPAPKSLQFVRDSAGRITGGVLR
jgi:hypothetical protein